MKSPHENVWSPKLGRHILRKNLPGALARLRREDENDRKERERVSREIEKINPSPSSEWY